MGKWMFTLALSLVSTLSIAAGGNETIQSFNKAKKLLLKEVYSEPSVRRTLYCDAQFDGKKQVTLPDGYQTTKYLNRLKRYETEHVVPAENFGRTFSEWRDGHPDCVDSKGRSFKGRKCAEKTNTEYRLMQSDMFNLFPAIGANNAYRSNYNFTMLPGSISNFGSCQMKVDGRRVEPPEASRGQIARSYLYMSTVYKRYNMSRQQQQLMEAWDKQYPVSAWECERAARIEKVQGNVNPIMVARCG